jgi:pimeloyl-ACP methyl ester carboxylesterase
MLSRREALAAGAAVFSTAFTSPLAASAHGGQAGMARPGRFRLADGRILAYCEFGNPTGPPVFYFHGTPGSRLEAALIDGEARNAGVRFISVDRPGIGRSTYHSHRRICDWPNDVVQLADGLGYAGTSFGIAAMSGGAPYATVCARMIPHRLTHVAIVSGHGPPGTPGVTAGSEDRLIAFMTRRPRLSRVGLNFVSRRLDRKPDKVAKRVMHNWAEVDRQLVLCTPGYYQFLIDNLDESIRCGVNGILTDVRLLGCPWGFELCEIQGVRISIWQGGCDRIAPPSMGRYFHSQIAGSEYHFDSRASHVTMFKWHAAEILSRFAIS